MSDRPLRLVVLANMISMLGSGMNAAAVVWYVLQVTHSEVSLGKLLVLQTLPALLLLPFSGVIIDREDRRHLVMLFDLARGAMVLVVAVVAIRGQVQLWHLYVMTVLVAAGFWLFWPTVTALLQELTPGAEFVRTNTLLLGGVQAGWLIAGSVVGFLYNHIGLGWILVIDFATYVLSFSCYLMVRKGRVTVQPVSSAAATATLGAWEKYWHELKEGVLYIKARPNVLLLGTSWALFVGAMLTQGAVTAPLSDRILHAGAVGYGWLNGGWGVGAFLSVFYSPLLIARWKSRRAAGYSLGLLAFFIFLAPYSRVVPIAVALYIIMGSGRGTGGTALSSEMMELIPKHFMGRVLNTFYLTGTVLQLGLSMAVAEVAHRSSLAAAFAMIAAVYAVACVSAILPEAEPGPAPVVMAEAAGE
ncbi:MAG TPA: MFS transporter [Terriglobales bacterium]|nr:MFS transporter [Terriglobales bacterium]